jgi:hypothetical protein
MPTVAQIRAEAAAARAASSLALKASLEASKRDLEDVTRSLEKTTITHEDARHASPPKEQEAATELAARSRELERDARVKQAEEEEEARSRQAASLVAPSPPATSHSAYVDRNRPLFTSKQVEGMLGRVPAPVMPAARGSTKAKGGVEVEAGATLREKLAEFHRGVQKLEAKATDLAKFEALVLHVIDKGGRDEVMRRKMEAAYAALGGGLDDDERLQKLWDKAHAFVPETGKGAIHSVEDDDGWSD